MSDGEHGDSAGTGGAATDSKAADGAGDSDADQLGPAGARYRFRVRFRLAPEGVTVDPATFETTMYRPAARPGESGWLFFRDNLWRGEINDHDHAREQASDALSVPVDAVTYRAFECTPTHYDALQEAIAGDLAAFRPDDVPEVLNKYFGSSIDVRR